MPEDGTSVVASGFVQLLGELKMVLQIYLTMCFPTYQENTLPVFKFIFTAPPRSLAGSQLLTRLLTFGLNLATARSLSPAAYGIAAVQFHLINTPILFLSREGFRRGCLRVDPHHPRATGKVLGVALLTIPIGALLSILVTLAILATTPTQDAVFHRAIIMQGIAAFIELLAEPLYILATVRLLFGVRVGCEALATIAKNAITLLLLLHWKVAPALAFSWGQLGYSIATLVGFGMYFALMSSTASVPVKSKDGRDGTNSKITRSSTRKEERTRSESNGGGAKKEPFIELDRDILRISGTFSLQAGGKLLLAEGSKAVLAAATPLQEQGVYGLVNNLGSLIVRTLFQPYEEIAFVAFSRAPSASSISPTTTAKEAAAIIKNKRERAGLLSTLCRGASFLGGLAAAFGPGYAYLALFMLYGTRWAESGAPAALALYSCYVALLAVNGILEAFVHAVADQRGLHQANMVLVAVSVVHMGLSVVSVNTAGAAGLLIADAVNMVLRIFYCLWFIGLFFKNIGGLEAVTLLPKQGTRLALFASLSITLVSQAVFLPEGAAAVAAAVVPPKFLAATSLGGLTIAPLAMRALMHVMIGVICLVGVLFTAYKSEKDVVTQLKSFRKKSE